MGASPSLPSPTRLTGRHILVTGGNRGIGYAVVEAAARSRAKVSFLGRDATSVELAEHALRQDGLDVSGYVADVTDESAVREAVERSVRNKGPVDVLVNNAGSSSVQGPFVTTPVSRWWAEVSVNLRGVAVCTSSVLTSMTGRRTGRIINMVSGTAKRPSPYNTAYSCSKAAVARFTDSLAEEVRDHGISVFSLRPGTVATRMTADFASSAEVLQWLPDQAATLDPQSPARAVAATLWLAEGHGDALSGLWLDAGDDLQALAGNATRTSSGPHHPMRP